jgi:hypothetical protein
MGKISVREKVDTCIYLQHKLLKLLKINKFLKELKSPFVFGHLTKGNYRFSMYL